MPYLDNSVTLWLSRKNACHSCKALSQTNPLLCTATATFPCRWVYTVINTRMFHQEPDNEIMVQLNKVYIYKLWDVCTLLNTRNSGELTVRGVSREASRFKAGVRLCPVPTLLALYRVDRHSRNPGNSVLQGGPAQQKPRIFCFPSFPLNLLWHLHSGEKYTVLYF